LSLQQAFSKKGNPTLKTIAKLFDGITTRQLDNESAKVCANYESIHNDYGILGGRILASDHQKQLKIMIEDKQLEEVNCG